MNINRLTSVLLALGGLITAVAVLWWLSFYGGIAKDLGVDLGRAVPCLYSSGGGCGIVSGLAQLAGSTPYDPTLFWVGIILLGVGMILKLSLSNAST